MRANHFYIGLQSLLYQGFRRFALIPALRGMLTCHREGGVDMDEVGNISDRVAMLHRQGPLLHQLSCAWAENMDAQYPAAQPLGQHLHQPGSLIICERAIILGEGLSNHLKGDSLLSRL